MTFSQKFMGISKFSLMPEGASHSRSATLDTTKGISQNFALRDSLLFYECTFLRHTVSEMESHLM